MGNLLTIAEARSAILKPANDTTANTKLTDIYIPAIEVPIVDIIGPVLKTTFSATVDGGGTSIVLEHTDVTVTSVAVNGSAHSGWVADKSAGIVYPAARGGRFPVGRQNVTVEWTAGPCASTADVPANIKLAAQIILAHLWQADQQGPRSDVVAADDGKMYSTPSGYAIPNRAATLLGAQRLPGHG